MTKIYHIPPTLYDALKAEGFELPRNCGDVNLHVPVDGLIALHFTQMLESDDLVKIGRALIRIGEQEVRTRRDE